MISTLGRRFVAAIALVLAAPLPAQVVPSVAAPPIQAPAAARAQDAAEYARQFGVGRDEAARRLAALEASVAVTDRLAERYRDRLAGISVEHRPRLRIVVALTGTAPVAPQRLVVDGYTLPIVFETGAKATRDRVIWAMTYHQAAIRAALPRPPAMGLDPRTGELVVVIGSTGAASQETLRRRIEAIAGVPTRLRLLDQVDVNLTAPQTVAPLSVPMPPPAPIPAGGGRLIGVSPADGKTYLCTSGFAVTDGARYAIATAAHCLDDLRYVTPDGTSVPLTFVGQWGWGYQDVQLNAVPGPLPGQFFADTAKATLRPVLAVRGRASTRAGDFVCHRGERTGYSCALVELIDFAPSGDLCGGACLPTWVEVAGPTCRGGDSGAPVFIGTTALGIVKGATYRAGGCAFWFYMSLDYLPRGWRPVIDAMPSAPPVPPPQNGAGTQR